MSKCRKLSIKFKKWTPLRKQFRSRTTDLSKVEVVTGGPVCIGGQPLLQNFLDTCVAGALVINEADKCSSKWAWVGLGKIDTVDWDVQGTDLVMNSVSSSFHICWALVCSLMTKAPATQVSQKILQKWLAANTTGPPVTTSTFDQIRCPTSKLFLSGVQFF